MSSRCYSMTLVEVFIRDMLRYDSRLRERVIGLRLGAGGEDGGINTCGNVSV